MSGVIRKFLGDFAIYGVGDIIIKATGFVTLPIYSRLLNVEGYGTWNLILAGVGMVSAVLVLGGDSAYIRFFFAAKTEDERQTITSTWFSFLALWSVVITLVCVAFSQPIAAWALDQPESALLVALGLLAAPVGLINALCAQTLRNQFRARPFVFWNVFSALLSVGGSLIGAVVFNFGVTGVLGGALIAGLIMLPIRLWTIRSMLALRFSVPLLRQLLAYGVPLMPGSVAYWVFASSDRLLLGQLTDLAQVGLYAVANQIANLIGFLYGALGQAWVPRSTALYETDRESAAPVFGQMLTYFLVLFGVMSVGITVFAPEIITVLSTPEFIPAAVAVGPLALGYVAYASTQVTSMSIMLTKKTYYLTILAWASAILNVVLNLILIPQLGMVAAAWSTTLSYVFLTLAYLFISQRLWAIAYEVRRGLLCVALTVAFTLAATRLPQLDFVASIALKAGYCLLFAAALALTGVLDRREWGAVSTLVRQVRARLAT